MRIEIQDLHKSFGTMQVLRGATLTIEPGEICVILGGSGQGKSVLLKHLVGLEKPDSGRILIDGVDIVHLSERDLAPYRKRFGMIFQNGGILQSLSVGDNVALPLVEIDGQTQAEALVKVKEKLAAVGLAGFETRDVNVLSGGQRKRVAIARALVQDADCLLFDEPTAGLDPVISQTVDDVIEEVNRDTKDTVILVTHDLISAFRLGTRLHLLDKGEIVFSGTPDEFRASEHPAAKRFLARGIA